MRALAAALLLSVAGCGDIPVVPVYDPPGPVNPPPQPPQPPNPQSGRGVITQAQFDAIADGANEADVRNSLGAPFQSHDAGGFTILTYVTKDTNRSVFVWLKAGKVDHRSSAP